MTLLKMRVYLSIAIVTAIVSLALVVAFVYKRPLTKEGFMQKKTEVTWYMADWCGHCKNMVPIWEEFSKKVDRSKVELKVVKDGEPGSKEAFAKAGVDGFPTIHMQKPGDAEPTVYNGPRTLDGLMKFVA